MLFKKLYDFNHSDYRPLKSKAYLKVVENGDVGRNIREEKLEKARKAIETRKHYSDIVKDIFFKDALLNTKSPNQPNIQKEIASLRDIKEEAQKKRKDEYEHHRLMHNLGKKYLEEIRHQNLKVTPQKRKAMDEKRFAKNINVPKKMKSRKYLDDVAREFKDPIEVVVQRDLMKHLNPTSGTDSKNAFIKNMKYFDDKLEDQETKVKYEAGKKDATLELGGMYINSIESKLKVLEKESNIPHKHDKKEKTEAAGLGTSLLSNKNLNNSQETKPTNISKVDPKPEIGRAHV